MKAKLFISFAAFAAASVLMSGCSNEESTAATNDQLTAFTGGIVTEVPMTRVQIGTSESSTVVPGIGTRTSMNRKAIGGGGAFLWEPGDVIYVEDDDGNLRKSQNTITGAAPRATFLVDGSYTAKSQYEVYYFGENPGAAEKKVVIADNQTQVAFNNTEHFGKVGDCGEAKAEKTTVSGKSGYKFDLEHGASYLCFLPYITSPEERESYKIQRIEITSDDNIAGTYELFPSMPGTDFAYPQLIGGEGESKTITLHVGTDGLLLADQTTATKSIKNSLYAVIAPGNYALKVKYTVLDTKTNAVIEMTKSYKSHYFAANEICDIPVSLGSADPGGPGGPDGPGYSGDEDYGIDLYGGYNYFMWCAVQSYWDGHEWDSAVPWQPIKNDASNDNYPKSRDDPRNYEFYDYLTHEGYNPTRPIPGPNRIFYTLPNANEMGWYVLKGDGHWDNSTRWKAFGTTHTGGIWLKKRSVIAQENGKTLAELKQKGPRGNNLRTSFDSYKITPKKGKPAGSVINKYFFLPALGHYHDGMFKYLGIDGAYWSNTASPHNKGYAYSLSFNSDFVNLTNEDCHRGFVAHHFEYSPRKF